MDKPPPPPPPVDPDYQAYLENKKKKMQRYKDKNSKPTETQILSRHPGLQAIRVKQQPNIKVTNAQFKETAKQVYALSKKDHKNPKEVYDQIATRKGQYFDLYKQLRVYVTRMGMNQKMRSMIAGKMIKKVSDQLRVPMKDAMCILLLDDFWEDVKKTAGDAYDVAKNFYHQNKQVVHHVLSGLVNAYLPAAKPVFDAAWTTFGGQLTSEDPYAINIDYVKSFLGIGPPAPASRSEIHFMYLMTQRQQIPVTTLADGTAIVVITPISCFYGNYATNSTFLPFVQVASSSSTNPFNAVPSYASAGPFASQFSSGTTFAVDGLTIEYINTEAALQCKGRLQTTFFYEPPNDTWNKSTTTGLYATSAVSITDQEIANNIGYVSRKSNVQCQRITRLGAYVQQQTKDACIPMNQKSNVGSDIMNSQTFIIMKFLNCNPNTQIGTLFITTTASIQPIASLRGILSVAPRGSYQGWYRAAKLCRKNGIPLQFLNPQQGQFLLKNNYKEINIAQYKANLYGQGQDFEVAGCRLLKKRDYPKGMCVHESLLDIGVQNNCSQWASLHEALDYTNNIAYLVGTECIFYKYPQLLDQFVFLNQSVHHALPYQIHDFAKLSQQYSNLIYFNELTKQYTNITHQLVVKSIRTVTIQKNPGPYIESVVNSQMTFGARILVEELSRESVGDNHLKCSQGQQKYFSGVDTANSRHVCTSFCFETGASALSSQGLGHSIALARHALMTIQKNPGPILQDIKTRYLMSKSDIMDLINDIQDQCESQAMRAYYQIYMTFFQQGNDTSKCYSMLFNYFYQFVYRQSSRLSLSQINSILVMHRQLLAFGHLLNSNGQTVLVQPREINNQNHKLINRLNRLQRNRLTIQLQLLRQGVQSNPGPYIFNTRFQAQSYQQFSQYVETQIEYFITWAVEQYPCINVYNNDKIYMNCAKQTGKLYLCFDHVHYQVYVVKLLQSVEDEKITYWHRTGLKAIQQQTVQKNPGPLDVIESDEEQPM